jgi:hypothetical protein
MIRTTTQNWTAGQTVKVGFLAGLLVVAAIPTPGDSAPDAYVLSRNEQLYSFVPHKGLSKISADEARELVAAGAAHARRVAAAALAKADASARHAELVAELVAA